jgi:hypothetical protein
MWGRCSNVFAIDIKVKVYLGIVGFIHGLCESKCDRETLHDLVSCSQGLPLVLEIGPPQQRQSAEEEQGNKQHHRE